MRFYADLHIHSRFSRATSRDCNLQQLALWGARKGIGVIGTGDFTHPGWRREIAEALVPSEPGLFRLRPAYTRHVEGKLPPICRTEARFLLQTEISTIYKRDGKTRKVHHLIFVPDLEKADRVTARLARIGNLASDGRPILGLDSRHLLEIVLEAGEGCFLIPAHIWTPWFSVLGSKSGFDAVDDCYADLASHIFALETGLSSDPPMNWRLSTLDRYRLISNSDAHSPPKLGREATVFDTDLDYFQMREALAGGPGYLGTVEFFPEEGKYHLDGHRKCESRLGPEETRQHAGLCPVCGKPVTVGVMHRVADLADRPEGARPPQAAPFRSFIPLAEVLSELLGTGAGSKAVGKAMNAAIARLGPELVILESVPMDEVGKAASPLLAEALRRMREGRVIRDAGYDGEYGVIHLFQPDELRGRERNGYLFNLPEPAEAEVPDDPAPEADPDGEDVYAPPAAKPAMIREGTPPPSGTPPRSLAFVGLDPDQQAAAAVVEGPLLIIAGPGTGKTRTLTQRLAHLVRDCGAQPETCLAITFTRRAAGEMRSRLAQLIPEETPRVPVMTFHALGLEMLREHGQRVGLQPGWRVLGETDCAHVLAGALSVSVAKAERLLEAVSRSRRGGDPPEAASDTGPAREAYEAGMARLRCIDFDDLIRLPVRLLDENSDLRDDYGRRFPWLSVDEFQDIDALQYRLLRRLAPPNGNLCAIGDPDQAIYGFRGTDAAFFDRFVEDFPTARVVRLMRNYRSGKSIVEAGQQVIAAAAHRRERGLLPMLRDGTRVALHEAATDKAEAEDVVHTIERMIGGSSFFSMDSGRVGSTEGGGCAFGDFGVLYRTDAQSGALCEAFERSGMPYQKRSHRPLIETPVAQAFARELLSGPAEGDLSQRARAAVQRLDADLRPEATRILRTLALLVAKSRSVEELLSSLALGVDHDLWDPRADAVSLLTLHAAKGLEFPVCFIVGCEDGILPLHWGSPEATDVEEERRLFYVGVTRARQRLILCHARRRLWRGATRDMAPSPFLRDIADRLLQRAVGRGGRRKARRVAEQLDLFAP